ncbi:N-acetylneuraminate synthase family protein, partial [Desulfonatronovibrio magnus]|uniref:N-acetylneuraminate synthase family protein n=1 Tax=Desulfonatronovibrio magnus TaxID=698827 RepID=UPI0005EAE096
MKIGNFDTSEKVFIIAEIGNNHEGDFELAKRMIQLAAEAGADAVKFQTIVPERLASCADQNRIAQLKKFQLSYAQFEELVRQVRQAGVVFLSTPFDLESARFLNQIQPVFKIASGDNAFFPLIDTVAGFNKPIIISTGLCDMEHIQNIYTRVRDVWQNTNSDPGLALLHCVASYPTSLEQANLGAIHTLKTEFPEAVIGYSDHTLGIDAAIYSVAAGARIVEKHFTLDKNYSGFRDHQLSADPDEFKNMVAGIKNVSQMLRSGQKIPCQFEESTAINIRRSIAASVNLPEGTVLSKQHLTWVRPGTGLQP